MRYQATTKIQKSRPFFLRCEWIWVSVFEIFPFHHMNSANLLRSAGDEKWIPTQIVKLRQIPYGRCGMGREFCNLASLDIVDYYNSSSLNYWKFKRQKNCNNHGGARLRDIQLDSEGCGLDQRTGEDITQASKEGSLRENALQRSAKKRPSSLCRNMSEKWMLCKLFWLPIFVVDFQFPKSFINR